MIKFGQRAYEHVIVVPFGCTNTVSGWTTKRVIRYGSDAETRDSSRHHAESSTCSCVTATTFAMAPEEDLKKRVARKLTKKRKEGHQVTMEIPERFRDGDDADEDCTALPGASAYMNQSVFGMIAAAGSQVDFNARFDGQSSDDEDESGEPSASQSTELKVEKTRKEKPMARPEKHRRKLSENKLLRSIPRLATRSSKTKYSPKREGSPSPESTTPEHTASEIQVSPTHSREQPVMSRMLEAKAELSMRPSFDTPRTSRDNLGTDDNGEQTPSSLAKRLMEIFNFEKAEDVIEGKVSEAGLEHANTDLNRIPMLVIKERLTARIHVHYGQAYLFLCIFTQEICK